MSDEKRYDKAFFEHIMGKVDWDVIATDTNYHNGLRPIISLLLELNLNMAILIKMMSGLMGVNEDADKFRCPVCISDVTPNGLGYCPECKKNGIITDLARIYPDKIHLGKEVGE